jgi:5-methylcytosine-specific restriction protein A
MTTLAKISTEKFVEILQDGSLVKPDDLLIFQTLYSREKQEASATDLARIIGWSDKNGVVGRIVGLGKRILKKYDIKQTIRENGKRKLWDFFFTGYYKGAFFIYQLRPELKQALEICKMTENIQPISFRNTYLFVWNPDKWSQWTNPNYESNIEKNIEELKNTGKVTLKWTCTSHKSIRPGDRAFLVRVGSNPTGIFASGKIVSNPFLSPHWSGEGKGVPRVLIEFDVLLNPEKDTILPLETLNKGILSKQTWTPRSSGVAIKREVVDELEKVWFDFLGSQKIQYNLSAEIAETAQIFIEGAAAQISQTRYERSKPARDECLKHYGYSCFVCGFDFEKFYGSLGYMFIHVHHLMQVATRKQEYQIDPIHDLRPVCPNCHSMLHKKDPPLTIEELKEIIKNEKDSAIY